MTNQSLAHPAHQSTTEVVVHDLIQDRTARGLEYFQEYGAEFVEVEPGVVRVPSRSGHGFYDVDSAAEECPCPDFVYRTSKHGVGCCHVYGVAIAAAHRRAVRRARRCDYCGERFRRADLVEVGPEQESWSMGAREGDRFCPECARFHGIL